MMETLRYSVDHRMNENAIICLYILHLLLSKGGERANKQYPTRKLCM